MTALRLDVTPSLSAEIQRLIAGLVDDEGEPEYIRIIATRTNALPLYRGWTEVVLLAPDGRVVVYDHELLDAPIERALDHAYLMAALVEGSRAFPLLASLVPVRPADALECDACGGSGKLPEPISSRVICKCGGIGWFPPS